MIIHFTGIGGIGVSALARYYHTEGHTVSGSDLVESEITEALKKEGIDVSIGNNSHINKKIDILIFSPAVKQDNPELQEAQKQGVVIMSYPQALGELTKNHFTIAISGTHGKSTTSSMIAQVLVEAGLDPTVIIGTKLKEFGDSTHSASSGLIPTHTEGSNCRVGKSEYLVIEADEYKESFLNYRPKVIVLTNIEEDHLDYYKNLENILNAFKKYISLLPKDGLLIANKEDQNILNIISEVGKSFDVKFYSKKSEDAEKIRKILTIPGEHNVSNASAVFALAKALGLNEEKTLETLADFKGSWRRMDEKETSINNKNITLINDYAHHPTEIEATLKAIREKYPERNVWCIFQPHQYQRTFFLFDNFVEVFKNAIDKNYVNKLSLTDIYDVAGREEDELKEKVNAHRLVEGIKSAKSTGNIEYIAKENIAEEVYKKIKENDILILMGAGDIYDVNKKLLLQ